MGGDEAAQDTKIADSKHSYKVESNTEAELRKEMKRAEDEIAELKQGHNRWRQQAAEWQQQHDTMQHEFAAAVAEHQAAAAQWSAKHGLQDATITGQQEAMHQALVSVTVAIKQLEEDHQKWRQEHGAVCARRLAEMQQQHNSQIYKMKQKYEGAIAEARNAEAQVVELQSQMQSRENDAILASPQLPLSKLSKRQRRERKAADQQKQRGAGDAEKMKIYVPIPLSDFKTHTPLSTHEMHQRNAMRQALAQVAENSKAQLGTPMYARGRGAGTGNTVTPMEELDDLIRSLPYCTQEHISRALDHITEHVTDSAVREELLRIKHLHEAPFESTAAISTLQEQLTQPRLQCGEMESEIDAATKAPLKSILKKTDYKPPPKLISKKKKTQQRTAKPSEEDLVWSPYGW